MRFVSHTRMVVTRIGGRHYAKLPQEKRRDECRQQRETRIHENIVLLLQNGIKGETAKTMKR